MTESPRWNPLFGKSWLFIILSVALVVGALLAGDHFISRSTTPTLALYVVPAATFGGLGILWALYRPPSTAEEVEGQPRGYAVTVAAFLVLSAVALLSVKDSPQWKPMLFYLAYAAAIGTLLAQGILAPKRGLAIAIGIVEVGILLAIYSAATQLPTFAGAGADTQFHRLAIERAAAAGSTSVITQPYSTFAGYYVLPVLLVMGGWGFKGALALVDAGLATALVAVCAVLARRAFGDRAALATIPLVAASPATLAMLAAVSPSKAGTWAVIAIAVCLLVRTGGGLILALVLAAAAFLYHPILGAAAAIVLTPAIILLDVFPAQRILHAWGRTIGLATTLPTSEPRPWVIPIIVLTLEAVVAIAYTVLSDPHLVAVLLAPVTHQGSQAAALGVVRVATLGSGFVAQTLLVNLSELVFFVPALFVATAAVFGAWKRDAAFVATMLLSVLAFIVAVILSGAFLLGPERFILIEDALVAIAAGAGLVVLAGRFRRHWARLALVLAVTLLLMAQSTSYRADGNALFSPDIPKQTDDLSAQTVAFVLSIKPHLSENDSASMDFFTSFHGANFPSHNEQTLWNDPISRYRTNTTSHGAIPPGDVYAWSKTAAKRSLEEPDWQRATAMNDALYDNGDIIAGVALGSRA